MPGDVVLAKREGVVFIPPHLAESLVETSEQTRLRDVFGKTRLAEGIYTPGQIDRQWSEDIDADFDGWLARNLSNSQLGVPVEGIEALLAQRQSGDKGPADVSTIAQVREAIDARSPTPPMHVHVMHCVYCRGRRHHRAQTISHNLRQRTRKGKVAYDRVDR